LSDEDLAEKRALADEMRQNPAKLAAISTAGRAQLRDKKKGGAKKSKLPAEPWAIAAGVGTVAAVAAGFFLRRRKS
jgi:hypothetical protein